MRFMKLISSFSNKLCAEIRHHYHFDYSISFVHDQITIHITEIYKKKLVLKIMFTIK